MRLGACAAPVGGVFHASVRVAETIDEEMLAPGDVQAAVKDKCAKISQGTKFTRHVVARVAWSESDIIVPIFVLKVFSVEVLLVVIVVFAVEVVIAVVIFIGLVVIVVDAIVIAIVAAP